MLSGADPVHLTGALADLVVHVRRAARPVAACSVPRTKEMHLVDTPGERGV